MSGAAGLFRREGLDHGFELIPHGFWTLPVSPGARLLLGWLHSHTDSYLARLTVNECRRVMGTSAVLKQLTELRDAGFLTIDVGGPGKRTSFTLLADPWLDLQGRRNRAGSGPVEPATSPDQDRYQS